jgi:hypothetical protein
MFFFLLHPLTGMRFSTDLMFSMCTSSLQATVDNAQPTLHMKESFILVEKGKLLRVGVQLNGTLQQPVFASLRLLGGEATSDVQLQLAWDASEGPGLKFVELPGLEASLEGPGSQALLQLRSATNAVILRQRDRTVMSPVDPADLPLFKFTAGRTAFPGDKVRIPVRLMQGSLIGVASVRYHLEVTTPVEAQFMPSAAASGFLQFSGDATSQDIVLPVEWVVIPPQAEYRVAARLEGFWNARTADQEGQVALHIFGVKNGTCPPGAALAKPQLNATAAQAVGWWQEGWVVQGSQPSGKCVGGRAQWLPNAALFFLF